MNFRTFVFIALAGLSAFATQGQARDRKTHYDKSWIYADPKTDAGTARALRAEQPRAEAPHFATPSRDQEIGDSANGS